MASTLHRLLRAIPLVALTVLFWGCEDGGVVQPQTELRPGPGTLLSTSGQIYTVVREGFSSSSSATITLGPTGSARVRVGDHEIFVPAGAVDRTTTFRLVKTSGTEIRFSLTATGSDGTNVGAAGFRKPIELSVFYGNSVNVSDPSRLSVGWVVNGVIQEMRFPVVDTAARKATAYLDHFSEYALVHP